MIQASCHCGAVHITVKTMPEHLIDCNCSICRRYGALWSLHEPDTVAVSATEGALSAYIWGQRSIHTMRCSHCGCVTHWEPLTPEAGSRLGINMRNADPHDIAGIRVRKFDGADSWTYIDKADN